MTWWMWYLAGMVSPIALVLLIALYIAVFRFDELEF